MGTIYQDRNTAVAGELGKRAADGARSPSASRAPAKPVETYQMQMVNDPLLSPLLLQMAVFSAIDATERTVGATSIRVTGEIEFQNASAPLRINNMYAADNGRRHAGLALRRHPASPTSCRAASTPCN